MMDKNYKLIASTVEEATELSNDFKRAGDYFRSAYWSGFADFLRARGDNEREYDLIMAKRTFTKLDAWSEDERAYAGGVFNAYNPSDPLHFEHMLITYRVEFQDPKDQGIAAYIMRDMGTRRLCLFVDDRSQDMGFYEILRVRDRVQYGHDHFPYGGFSFQFGRGFRDERSSSSEGLKDFLDRFFLMNRIPSERYYYASSAKDEAPWVKRYTG